MESGNLLDFYRDVVWNRTLPFWLKAVDAEHGGVFTCYNNAGTERLSSDKFTWSQGRFVWLWSRVADQCRRGLLPGDPGPFLTQAEKTVQFLRRHAVLDNGNCAFLLTRTGERKESIPGAGYDTSFFADCFVILGLAEYARVGGDRDTLEFALTLFDRVCSRVERGELRSEPYSIPPGCRSHSVPMILLNVAEELGEALHRHGHARTDEVRGRAERSAAEVMEVFLGEDLRMREFVADDPKLAETLAVRHFNPGHAIECLWFVMATARRIGRRDWIERAAAAIRRSCELGWDREYGGLYRFVDADGGEPSGSRTGEAYERLILDTWDMKLWWPHSESLYATLLAADWTGEPAMAEWYGLLHRYTFATFPHPDPAVGEWIQIRERTGRPQDKVVALPVKDPFHLLRNALLIVELLHAGGAAEKTRNLPV